ncbi:MAG: bifunctional diaminohydroxyphosphoribosylaminopyrimidine deaminase/5-amino-6-(5-phosphoribosylamino)uracil reductase RibD [Cyclobacteriaceae bacterium]|nr:bifunctional diaminohydroxyphosphoribosylaminopyrimidine deaminase/5-amino-6-(5-phosphoribosylamino)uracil reductase RibD [Cyclobacteriaceae bacterium]
MLRALELAGNGLGRVSPNPMVGCVIVKEDKIIGEGWHQVYGGPHAEVNAVNSIEDKNQLKGSEVYVNLEPCAHYGKTPPCADLLVKHQVQHVIISNRDINPQVQGKGIRILESAGIQVTEGMLAPEGYKLNKRFFTFHSKERPYIILKWAVTADGYMARTNHDSKWISNIYSRQIVHKWRSEEDGIMIGANTVLHDDPALNVRDWKGKDPARIIIDPHLKIRGNYQIFDQRQKTLVYNLGEDREIENIIWIKPEESSFIQGIFRDLMHRGIQSVLVEGGKFLLESIIHAGLWDEARIFASPLTFGNGLEAPHLVDGELIEKQSIFDDDLLIFKKRIH